MGVLFIVKLFNFLFYYEINFILFQYLNNKTLWKFKDVIVGPLVLKFRLTETNVDLKAVIIEYLRKIYI